MAPNGRSKYQNCSLDKAPVDFYNKLLEILNRPSLPGHTSTWKVIAKLPELAVPPEKFQEIDKCENCAEELLRHLVFEHPKRKELTVRRMQDIARTMGNQAIVDEFETIKRNLQHPTDQPVFTAADVHDKPSLPVFDNPLYRFVRRCTNCPYLFSLILVFLLFQFIHCLKLTHTELENNFLNPETAGTKYWLLVIQRVWIRIFTTLLFAYKIFIHRIADVPEVLLHHKLLRILQGYPEYLLKLHKKHALPVEYAQMKSHIRGKRVAERTLATLFSPINWMACAAFANSIFVPLFLYRAGGLSYSHLASCPLFTTVSSLMDGISIFVTLITISITYIFFAYEYRLMKYTNALVDEDSNVKEIAKDVCREIANRWHWLYYYSIFAVILISSVIGIHWMLDTPLTTACMPFPGSSTPIQWFYCILLLSASSFLTFWNVENTLRVVKKAVCLICILAVIVHSSLLQSFIGIDRIHLHILLYLIPLVALFWTIWTFGASYLIIFRYQKKKTFYTFLRILLNASLLVIIILCLIFSTTLEYRFINASASQNGTLPSCISIQNTDHQLQISGSTLDLPSSSTSEPKLSQNIPTPDCSKLSKRNSHLNVNFPRVLILIHTSYPFPDYCYFYHGVYHFQFQVFLLSENLLRAKLEYNAVQLHKPESRNQLPCMCPQAGYFIVIYHSSIPIVIDSRMCHNGDFHLVDGYQSTDVLNLIVNLCADPMLPNV